MPHFFCSCKNFYVKSDKTCLLKDYCEDNPCVGDAVCSNKNPCGTNSYDAEQCSKAPNETIQYFSCSCKGEWYGNLCQCHKNLNSGGEACLLIVPPEEIAQADVGLIVGIILAVLLLIGMYLQVYFSIFWSCIFCNLAYYRSNIISKFIEKIFVCSDCLQSQYNGLKLFHALEKMFSKEDNSLSNAVVMATGRQSVYTMHNLQAVYETESKLPLAGGEWKQSSTPLFCFLMYFLFFTWVVWRTEFRFSWVAMIGLVALFWNRYI